MEGDGQVNHASIISSNKKEKGKRVLKYSGHTKERNNYPVIKSYSPGYILKIIRLKNKYEIPYLY